MTQGNSSAAFRYYAFISYSHQDKTWADWLHKALETYVVPKRLVGQTTGAAGPPDTTPYSRAQYQPVIEPQEASHERITKHAGFGIENHRCSTRHCRTT
jgi:hypothetical protein